MIGGLRHKKERPSSFNCIQVRSVLFCRRSPNSRGTPGGGAPLLARLSLQGLEDLPAQGHQRS